MTPEKTKTIPSITLLVFGTAILCFFIMLFLPLNSQAAYQIEMGLPNLPSGSAVQNPAQYIQYFFIFGLSLIGFLAVAALAVGGIMWMIGGSITSTEKAKNIIVGAVSGVVLLLCSYLLLYTIDPSLVNLTPHIAPLGKVPEVPASTTSIYEKCSPNGKWDVRTNKCVPCPAGQITDSATNGYSCASKPSGYSPDKCTVKDTPTCTEGDCAAGGKCATLHEWCAKTCICVLSESILTECPSTTYQPAD